MLALACLRLQNNIPRIYFLRYTKGNDSSIQHLEAELGAAPVSALGVVLDGVVGTEADPLGKGAVLPLLLGKSALGAEGLLGRLLMVFGRGDGGKREVKKVRTDAQ